MADWNRNNRRGSISINVHELTDEGEEDQLVLKEYFNAVVLPLSVVPDSTSDIDNDEEEGHPAYASGGAAAARRRSSGNMDFEEVPIRTRERR